VQPRALFIALSSELLVVPSTQTESVTPRWLGTLTRTSQFRVFSPALATATFSSSFFSTSTPIIEGFRLGRQSQPRQGSSILVLVSAPVDLVKSTLAFSQTISLVLFR
jgi:hypothetical protein